MNVSHDFARHDFAKPMKTLTPRQIETERAVAELADGMEKRKDA